MDVCARWVWPILSRLKDFIEKTTGRKSFAEGFYRENNWSQVLRHSDLAATKLKQLNDRPVEDISQALSYKCDALGFLGRNREQWECAKEWYCLWNMKPTDVGAIDAAFALIESCIQNNEFADAHLYASTLWEIINHKHDNKIPDDQRQRYIANGAYYLAATTLRLSQHGGIPPEEKQKSGEEAIALARKALEIHTQLRGTENEDVAADTSLLADALAHFKDDDEVFRLYEQAKAIHARVYGSSSANVAMVEGKLGAGYCRRAMIANVANDFDCALANLEQALSRFREAARIYRVINIEEKAERALREIAQIEENMRRTRIARAAAATTATQTATAAATAATAGTRG